MDRSVPLSARAQAVSLLQQLNHPVQTSCFPVMHDVKHTYFGFVNLPYLFFTGCQVAPLFSVYRDELGCYANLRQSDF